MSTESLLNEYLAKTRAAAEKRESSEVAARVEAAFDHLKLPWRRDGESWQIDSDVGRISAGLDDDHEVLTFSQIINELPRPPKKSGEFFYTLLKLNFQTTGACYAVLEPEDGAKPVLFVLGRISAESLDPEEVALTLESVFSLSAVFD